MCGCNTSLLNAYTECRLCGKFCFPDFRLAGNPGIELCENCVETVLQLCLPSDPEQLEVGEECLALRQVNRPTITQPFFQPFGGNEPNWIFQNLEFSEKFLEFSQKILDFSEKFLMLGFREK